jgi:UDP-N-acetylglucosamine 4,6-dehydratase
MDILNLIGRDRELFEDDVCANERTISGLVDQGTFLVIGGAGSIGQAVTKEIFKRKPRKLHVVDISENNMVELIRDIRSSLGYIDGDFRTFVLDVGSPEFDAYFTAEGPFDYVLNLSALKHVRSEKDPYTLMRMIDVNIFNTDKTVLQAHKCGAKQYFAVSTDKAANPVNMMGASKRIMEMFLMRRSSIQPISTARFANVAFSDGSLLHGFNQRMHKQQPIAAPNDIKRYFVTPQESGELCLMSCLLGETGDIFFPKLSERLHLITFAEIAVKYLEALGFEPYLCSSEDEARTRVQELSAQKQWPCYFFNSNTTGEKDFEEFFTDQEVIETLRFKNIGVIKSVPRFEVGKLETFASEIRRLKAAGAWKRSELVDAFNSVLPNFNHKETGRFLDDRM